MLTSGQSSSSDVVRDHVDIRSSYHSVVGSVGDEGRGKVDKVSFFENKGSARRPLESGDSDPVPPSPIKGVTSPIGLTSFGSMGGFEAPT